MVLPKTSRVKIGSAAPAAGVTPLGSRNSKAWFGGWWVWRAGKSAAFCVRSYVGAMRWKWRSTLEPTAVRSARAAERIRPGYDTSSTSWRFDFIPLWSIAVVFVYHMRRVDCPNGGVNVEWIARADGKSPLTHEYAWRIGRGGCLGEKWPRRSGSVGTAYPRR